MQNLAYTVLKSRGNSPFFDNINERIMLRNLEYVESGKCAETRALMMKNKALIRLWHQWQLSPRHFNKTTIHECTSRTPYPHCLLFLSFLQHDDGTPQASVVFCEQLK